MSKQGNNHIVIMIQNPLNLESIEHRKPNNAYKCPNCRRMQLLGKNNLVKSHKNLPVASSKEFSIKSLIEDVRKVSRRRFSLEDWCDGSGKKDFCSDSLSDIVEFSSILFRWTYLWPHKVQSHRCLRLCSCNRRRFAYHSTPSAQTPPEPVYT